MSTTKSMTANDPGNVAAPNIDSEMEVDPQPDALLMRDLTEHLQKRCTTDAIRTLTHAPGFVVTQLHQAQYLAILTEKS